MFLNFKQITIEGFQSIGKATIDLSEQGIVLVKGVNNYEDNTSSNGSGKSSVFEAIYFAIYGKTTEGISNPTNRYYNGGCCVSVLFSINDVDYTITRSINHREYGTQLKLYKSGEDISARNKTDTEKIIQNDIFDFSNDIFLSIVFLSQGFHNKITSLSPSARKDRLENLTRTSSRIEKFKNELLSLKAKYSDNSIKLSNKKSELIGEISALEREMQRLQNTVNKAESVELPHISKEILESKISSFNERLESLSKDKSALLDKKSKLGYKIQEVKVNMSQLSKQKDSIVEELKEIDNSICPLCKQSMSSIIHNGVKKEKTDKLVEIRIGIECLENELNSLDFNYKVLESELEGKIDMEDKFREAKNVAQRELDKYSDYKDVSQEKIRISEIQKELEILNIKISKFETSIEGENDKQSAVTNMTNILTKQFRSYLLDNVIMFMNERVKYYSEVLFSNEEDIITIQNDSSKIEIYLGEANYNSLSGGEKRKVDLALVLAQRDLAISISGTSSNILIMDEVYDNLDDLAMNAVMEMFNDSAENIDSMFIISHRLPKEVPFDTVMQVTKSKSRVSSVEFVGAI